MAQRFDYFVVFGEMRTGSNFLEANLNALDGVACYGEAFNPHFIGYPNRTDILGLTQAERDADPFLLLQAVKDDPSGLAGFRFFNDHDPRILDHMLNDPRCAKIVLTRNPLDSYVSWKIAQATGQWKLTDVRNRKDSKVRFDSAEFAAHVERLQQFQIRILSALQTSGQTAFYVAFEDLQDLDVMNGLAQFLDVPARLEALDSKLKRQNPSPVSEKVTNPEAVAAALVEMDQFNLSRTPNFEPRRGAAVPSYLAAEKARLLFMPIPGGPSQGISQWLETLDGGGLVSGLNQSQLRAFKKSTPGHRSFTVVRHPVARAHEVFCDKILSDGPGGFRKIRNTLRNRFGLPIPEALPDAGYDSDAHRAAFAAFLNWVQMNVSGQTAIRQDGHWVSQASILEGFAAVQSPDFVLREDELAQELPRIAASVTGRALGYAPDEGHAPVGLADIYDAEIEKRARFAYARDYESFGFGDWA